MRISFSYCCCVNRRCLRHMALNIWIGITLIAVTIWLQTRRTRRRAAEYIFSYMSSESSVQRSIKLSGNGYSIAVMTTATFMFFAMVIMLLPLQQAYAAVYQMPTNGDDIVGQIFTVKVQPKDSSTTIRQRYGISIQELFEANPHINFNKLVEGQVIVIPTQFILPKYRDGIVINTAELRLYYFSPDGQSVYTYPVGLGRMNWRTPTAITAVVRKQYHPTWYVPDSIRDYMYERHGKLLPDAVPPGPENPLGEYALYLAKRGYLIHGTNMPETVGTFASSGCMRLEADAIEQLYKDVAIGTPVHIVHHPNKAGWFDGVLYLESHAPIQGYEKNSVLNSEDAASAIRDATANYRVNINWQLVEEVTDNNTGIPVPIGK